MAAAALIAWFLGVVLRFTWAPFVPSPPSALLVALLGALLVSIVVAFGQRVLAGRIPSVVDVLLNAAEASVSASNTIGLLRRGSQPARLLASLVTWVYAALVVFALTCAVTGREFDRAGRITKWSPIFTAIHCPVCGVASPELRTIEQRVVAFEGRLTRYGVIRCDACGSEFSSPMLAAPREWYDQREEFYGWRWEFTEALEDLRRYISGSPRRVLEIGCGEGILLERLAQVYNACGLDVNGAAVRVASGKGLRAVDMPLEEFVSEHPEVRFDAVLVFHVLEHLPDPAAFLASVSRLLNPGGSVLISVPNPDRAGLIFGREEWDYPPHHLSRFSREGLRRLVSRTGFMVLEMKDEPTEGTVPIASMLANGLVRRFGVSLTEWSRPARALLKSPFVLGCLPLAAYQRTRKSGVALYVVARVATATYSGERPAGRDGDTKGLW